MEIFSEAAAKPFLNMLAESPSVPELWLKGFREAHSKADPEGMASFSQIGVKKETCVTRDNHPIPLTIFEPPHPIRRTFLYIHGGGFISPLGGKHLTWAKYIAAHANVKVVCIDHRVAPEYSFPIPLYDCIDVYRHYLMSSDDVLVVGGDSSGGNLSLGVGQYCLQEGLAPPSRIMALCAVTNLRFEKYQSMLNRGVDNPNVPQLFLAMGAFQRACYTPDIQDWSNPLVSPIHADLRRFPPTLIVAAGSDYSYEDNREFAETMRSQGGPVDLREYAGMPHSFFTYLKLLPAQAEVANKEIIRFLCDRS